MKKTLFAILAVLLCFSFAEAQQVIVMKKAAGAGGPDAWYYSCTDTPATEPTWADGHTTSSNTNVTLTPITISSGGSITKFSIKGDETYAEYAKLALYSVSGNTATQLSTSCTTGSFIPGWIDCTLGTPYTVSSGSYYIGIITDINAFVKRLTTNNEKLCSSQTYADFPKSEYTGVGDVSNHCTAVRLYVD